MTKLLFDMDGTIADLYSAQEWLDAIMSEEKGLFANLQPMFTKQEILSMAKYIENFTGNTVEMEIITWTPMNGSDRYCQIVADEKREWLEVYFPGTFSQIHILPYGVPKQFAQTKRTNKMILIDDNSEVLAMWESPRIRKGILRTPEMTIAELTEKILNT